MKTAQKVFGIFLIVLACMPSVVLKAQVYQSGPPPQVYQGVPTNIVVPQWAPAYENVSNIRYYYLPDYEIYYDVWEQEFVYLENGIWRFSPYLPAYLGNINLYDAYVVILDTRVHEPWRFHEQYLAHYPRFYYHTFPANIRRENLRGYNENVRINVYAPRHPDADRGYQPLRTSPSNREPMHVQYGSRSVGQPVVVQPNMRNPNFGRDGGRGDRDGHRDDGRERERH